MVEKFDVEYIPGGATQNTVRVTQVCTVPALVVQRVDNVIQQVNCYPVDKMYSN